MSGKLRNESARPGEAGVLRHPREARLTPQAQAFSREGSQRYSRRARRDAATGRQAPAGDWLRRSPKSVSSIWAARGVQARQGLHQGHFLVLFVARDKKNNQRRLASGIALASTAAPCRPGQTNRSLRAKSRKITHIKRGRHCRPFSLATRLRALQRKPLRHVADKQPTRRHRNPR